MTKSLKSGFTLAEVLVAIGVAGVISAIMIPSLVSNTQNKKLAASLGRSVEAIESGCQSLIQEASEKSTTGMFTGHNFIHKDVNGNDYGTNTNNSVGGTNLFAGNAAKFFSTRELSASERTQYHNKVKAYSGAAATPGPNSIESKVFVNSKLGSYWGLMKNSNVTSDIDQIDPIEEYVYVDVNGESSPNRYGLDIYLFGLTDRCHMIPAGSSRFNSVLSSVPEESTGCSGTNVTNGLSCTQRVVREGYNIEYEK